MKKIFYVVGARPQFMQAAMVEKAFKDKKWADFRIIHTGQHFDENMSNVFFKQLKISPPYINLNVNSLTHGAMVGRVLERFEELVISEKPDIVIVDGDTNSTLAGALVAVKSKIISIHIEAGLRSYDMRMPEEINRLVVDNCCDYLYCPTQVALNNLKKSNLGHKAKITGDVLFDTFCHYSPISKGKASDILNMAKLKGNDFYLLTVHREENLLDRKKMEEIFRSLPKLEKKIIFPVHPSTARIIEEYNIDLKTMKNLCLMEPVGYLEIIDLMARTICIITDSGGIQREGYWSKKPVVVLRNNTEWIEQLETGWTMLVEDENVCNLPDIVNKTINNVKDDKYNEFYGDGSSSEKIALDIEENVI